MNPHNQTPRRFLDRCKGTSKGYILALLCGVAAGFLLGLAI